MLDLHELTTSNSGRNRYKPKTKRVKTTRKAAPQGWEKQFARTLRQMVANLKADVDKLKAHQDTTGERGELINSLAAASPFSRAELAKFGTNQLEMMATKYGIISNQSLNSYRPAQAPVWRDEEIGRKKLTG